MVAIIDYHAGNIGSIKNMLSRLGYDSVITNDENEIARARHLILPGVGSFDYGMNKLDSLQLLPVLNDQVNIRKKPILGICLGAQLMCNESEEGSRTGLEWIDGSVVKFPSTFKEKKNSVPQMGWEDVNPKAHSKIFENIKDGRFYFAHSYCIQCTNQDLVIAQNTYGITYDSVFEKENIVGVQFHPEKSHTFGMALLTNFVERY